MPVWSILLLLLLGAAVAAPSPALVCSARADAVALVAGACALQLDCRYELGADANAVLSLAEWDTLLTMQTHLLASDYATVDPSDARFMFTAAPYVTLPLLAYDPGNTSGVSVDCAALLQASELDPEAALVPDQVFDVLDTLSKYQHYVSPQAQCPDDNEVWTWSNTTTLGPRLVCQCAPGKVCTSGNATVSSILAVIGIFVAVLIFGLLVFTVVTVPMLLRKAAILELKLAYIEKEHALGPLGPMNPLL
jgi:hypothetical protein